MKTFYTKSSKSKIGIPNQKAKPIIKELEKKDLIVSQVKKYGVFEVNEDGFKLVQKLINIEVM